MTLLFFFFFQAEDGIRDDLVTGVQTCALPICAGAGEPRTACGDARRCGQRHGTQAGRLAHRLRGVSGGTALPDALDARRSRNSTRRGSIDKLNPWERRYPAPAKLNLFLHVVGRRPDGYHLLQTAFRLIECCDWLRFSPRADAEVRRTRALPGIAEDEDLAVRAARLLQAEGGSKRGVDLDIEKNIPVGGGLGGGSTDCATTLAVLNRLWGLALPKERLAAMALTLGADVPFFLFGGNAFAQGIGERLAPLELPQAWYVVLVPPIAVATQAIFAAPELTRNSKTIKISSFSAGFGRNDLESVVCGRHAEVAAHLEWLRRFGDARMSGSGACVFVEFASEREPSSVLSKMPAEMRGFAVRGLDRHPLAALLEQV